MRLIFPLLAAILLLAPHALQAALIISEVQASNATTLVDADGDSSDWLELYNSGPSSVDLGGYHLTDDPADLSKWTFPAVTIQPGGFLVVFASSKDRDPVSGELHTNFRLSAGGDYLGVIMRDGVTTVDEYAPQFSAMADDESYGPGFSGTTFIDEGAAADVLVPTNGALGTSWTSRTFDPNASWQDLKTKVGFGAVGGPSLDGLVAYYDFEEGTGTTLLDKSGNNHHGTLVNMNSSDWVSGKSGLGTALDFDGSNDHVTLRAANTLGFQGNFTASAWIRLDNTNGDNTILGQDAAALHLTTRGNKNHFGFWGNDTSGGSQTLSIGQWTHLAWRYNNGEQTMFQNGVLDNSTGGHAALSNNSTIAIGRSNGNQGWFNGRIDEVAIFDKPLSNSEIAALSSGEPLAAGGGLEDAMLGNNATAYIRVPFAVTSLSSIDSLSLRMQYNDGFVAYLNGTEVARRNAPPSVAWNSAATASRSAAASQSEEAFNLTGSKNLLVVGTNVLAIQGLNASSTSDTFLINPILSAGTLGSGAPGILASPTPGGPNTSVSSFGQVADVEFSVERGLYSSSMPVTLSTSTPSAQIRYTTNGTEPTSTSGTLYSSPITVNKTTVLRAIAYRNSYTASPVETKTYLFINDVVNQGSTPPSGWPTGTVNGQVLDYGMDSPGAVGTTTAELRSALQSLDAISVVTDPDSLFDSSDGIYVHAGSRGRAWERASSVELLEKDGGDGFQIDAGLRIRGGFSRSGNNPKHAFRLFFRDEYGGDLKYPVFGGEGADRFKNLDLRTAQNYSWSFQGGSNNTFMREVFARDSQKAMGRSYTRSRYYHLYVNGIYWGLYMSQERAEASFGETYFGGDADDYDVVKSAGSAGGYTIEATDGEMTGWAAFWARANTMAASSNATTRFNIFQELQGLNPNGTRNASFPVYLDVDNLIDYMMVILFVGSYDAPVSNFLGNDRPNNWFSVWNRTGDFGFQFFAHDCEHSLGTGGGANIENRNGPWPAGQTQQYSNPQWIHQQLMSVDAYRIAFGDRAHELFFNGGILTSTKSIDRVNARAAVIDQAIIAESARWGDSKRADPRTRNDWLNAVNGVRSYLTSRPGILLGQLRNTRRYNGGNSSNGLVDAPLYPSVTAPAFNQHGGNVPSDFGLRFSGTGGTIYYTTDGTDPRTANGSVSSSAQTADEGAISSQTLYAPSSGIRAFVPANGNLGTSWRNVSFNDSSWLSGSGGVGYDQNTTYDSLIDLDVRGPLDDVNTSIYIRSTFSVADPDAFQGLTLRLMFEDGFVAFLNGQEVASFNAPGGLAWNSEATGLHGDDVAVTFVDFDLTAHLDKLVAGTNVLAFQGLNDNLGSSDFLLLPELVGNRVSGGSSVTLPSTFTEVNARTLQNGEWSALNSAAFVISALPASSDSLVISEIMYNPGDSSAAEIAAGFTDADEFEYLELMNISDQPISLVGYQFADGITFDFAETAGAIIDPGQRVVLVKNLAAFEFRYGTTARIAGVYTGSLSNGGETLQINDASGGLVRSLTYDDAEPWPAAADGFGLSLIIINPHGNPDPETSDSWRASSEGGSPGFGDGEGVPGILVNEVLTHTDWPQVDAIELFNPTSEAVEVGGWYLTDNSNTPTKYRLPNGTSVPANGYLVVEEDNDADPDNNASLPDQYFGSAFSLSSTGDEVYLYSADGAGLTGYRDGFGFKGAANGVSFGRLSVSNGDIRYPASSISTLGSANAEPLRPDIVISEVMYNPASTTGEYVEIWNISSESVLLYDSENPENTWRVDGMDYNFPTGQSLASGETALVVEGDPSVFRVANGIASSLKVFGPVGGAIDNGGERLELLRPDSPTEKNGEIVVPMIVVDAVEFDDEDPWPVSADGQGPSLERVSAEVFGDEVASWIGSSASGGSPGIIPGRLVVSVSSQGQGTVSLTPNKLEFESGEMVSLTPQASPGWSFVRWVGGASGSAVPLVLTVNESVSVEAVFEENIETYSLTVVASGGTVSASPSQPIYDEGTQVTLTASPAPGTRFVRWEGDLTGEINPSALTMNKNRSVTAIFAQQVALTTMVNGPGNIVITPDRDVYDVGEQVTLTATPLGNAAFDRWSGGASGTQTSLVVTMDTGKTVTATFVDHYNLTANAQPGGSVSVSPLLPDYRSGSQVVLTATSQPGFRFVGWTGGASGDANPLTLVVQADTVISAQFEALSLLALSSQGSGQVIASPAKPSYQNGEQVMLTATPADGWSFVNWVGAVSGTANPTGLVMNGNANVTAVFKQWFAVEVFTSGEGTVSKSPEQSSYLDGASVSITAAAAPEWEFVRWDDDGDGSTSNPLSLTISAARRVTAVFRQIEQDTPFETWQKDNFTEAERADALLSGPMADPDGDRLANLLEHVFGTDPRDRSSSKGITTSYAEGDGQVALQVEVVVQSQEGIRYRLEVSPDLVSWFYNGDGTGKTYVSDASTQPSASGERLVWTVNPPDDGSNPYYSRFVAQLDE